MSDVFLLTRQQLNRIKPYFPVSHGIPRVDDRRVISGIIYVIRYGLHGMMRRRPMARTRHSTTGLFAGAERGSFTRSSTSCRDSPEPETV
jgi:hypothetical protein